MKPLLMFGFALLPLATVAQAYKPFKINLSAGYGIQPVARSKGGALVSLEPRYGLNNQFEVGLRLEGTYPAQETPAAIYQYGRDRFMQTPVVSALATANYWLAPGRVRPYVGVGIGPYWATTSTYRATALPNGGSSVESIGRSVSRFGGMFRVGVKTGHLNVAAEYNLLGSTTQQDEDHTNAPVIATINGQPVYANTFRTLTWTTRNAYLGFKVGFDIGGGRR